MNEEDISNIIQKISTMMNTSNNSNTENVSSSNSDFNFNNVQELLSNMKSETNNNDFNSNNTNSTTNNFNLDFNTIMKIKSIMDRFNSYNNSPETTLLMSLKPYLNNNRKNKLEQYIQFLNIAKLFENFNSNGDVNIK